MPTENMKKFLKANDSEETKKEENVDKTEKSPKYTVHNDPAIKESKLDVAPAEEKPKVEESISVAITDKLNLSQAPWLTVKTLADTADGVYIGTLLSNSLKYDNKSIMLELALPSGKEEKVIAFIRKNVVYVFKLSDLCPDNCCSKYITDYQPTTDDTKSFSFFDYGTTVDIPTMEMAIGSVLLSIAVTHAMHLVTDNYVYHIALQDYYEEMPELIDSLAEQWIQSHQVTAFGNSISVPECPIEYLTSLEKLIVRIKTDFEESELYQSELDAILSLIRSCLYKMEKLTNTENKMVRKFSAVSPVRKFLKNEDDINVTDQDKFEFNMWIKSKSSKTPRLRKKFKTDQEYEDFMMERQFSNDDDDVYYQPAYKEFIPLVRKYRTVNGPRPSLKDLKRSLDKAWETVVGDKSFSEIKSEDEFRKYAHTVMKEAHGDEYSEEVTNKVVDDLIKDNPKADYGELIGRLTSGFGDKNFSSKIRFACCDKDGNWFAAVDKAGYYNYEFDSEEDAKELVDLGSKIENCSNMKQAQKYHDQFTELIKRSK